MGPAPHRHPDSIIIDGNKITNAVIAKIISGFAFGMVGQNNLEIIENCYDGAEEITENLIDSIRGYIAGGWNYYTQASLKLVLVGLEITKEVEVTCVGITDEFDAIGEWATFFNDLPQLKKRVVRRAELNRLEVKAIRSEMEGDWESDHYFEVGKDLASMATLLIGPIATNSTIATI